MPTEPSDEPTGGKVAAKVRGSVLKALGTPADLLRIAVLPLWAGHYRVNVLTGPDIAAARVAHSFFVLADDGGHLVESNPTIRRHY